MDPPGRHGQPLRPCRGGAGRGVVATPPSQVNLLQKNYSKRKKNRKTEGGARSRSPGMASGGGGGGGRGGWVARGRGAGPGQAGRVAQGAARPAAWAPAWGRGPGAPRGAAELWGAGEAGGLWEVEVPLVGMEAAGEALGQAYPRWMRHRVLVVGCSEGLVAFDFLPLEPLEPATAGALLTGRAVPGEVRERKLKGKRLPDSLAVRSVGTLHRPTLALRRARAFNGKFDLELKLIRHDCEVYSRELTEHLLLGDRF